MKIGIDASRAFIKNRTGIEEYSYQAIKSLTHEIENDQARLASTSGHLRESRRVVLYVRKNQQIDFDLPKSWKVKVVGFYYLWTQLGLSLEMLLHPVDVLFVPAHTVPVIHPQNTVVTIHGLEYEFCPEAYSFWERIYMRFSIKNSCKWAKKIIAVSENTKKDLMNLYKVPEEKIKVIYEGYENNNQTVCDNKISKPYLLFIGRLEERKNIVGIVESFDILKNKYKIPHKLVLAGKPNHGYEKIKEKIENSQHKKDIILPGFVKDEKKFSLLNQADVFIFPSLYEGFGLPILEAQNAGVPVVSSNVSSILEVADGSVLLVSPYKPEEIAEAAYKLISDEVLKNDIIKIGYENVKRFSWEKCAKEIVGIITS